MGSGWPEATIPRPRGPSVWDGQLAAGDPSSWTLDPEDPGTAGSAEIAAHVDDRLRHGRGFVVVSGFPVDDRAAACQQFTDLAARLGTLLPQNTAGDLLHLVQTRGGGADRRDGSRGSGELLFHTDQAAAPPADRPRVLGLLCLDRAARGGHTQLASGHALLRELLDDSGHGHAAALRTPVPFSRDPDGVSDAPPVRVPVVEPTPDGRAAVRFNRYFVEVGARTTGTGVPPSVLEALDAADEVLGRGHLAHQLLLEPGQALFVDNLTVLHNRTAYVDDDGHRRCLARAWVR